MIGFRGDYAQGSKSEPRVGISRPYHPSCRAEMATLDDADACGHSLHRKIRRTGRLEIKKFGQIIAIGDVGCMVAQPTNCFVAHERLLPGTPLRSIQRGRSTGSPYRIARYSAETYPETPGLSASATLHQSLPLFVTQFWRTSRVPSGRPMMIL